jgi:hypothetical protein
MNYIDSLRYKAGVLGDPEAKRRLSAAGKKGAQTRKANKAFTEWVLDQLHSKPLVVDYEAPSMNEDGDMVPGYAL